MDRGRRSNVEISYHLLRPITIALYSPCGSIVSRVHDARLVDRGRVMKVYAHGWMKLLVMHAGSRVVQVHVDYLFVVAITHLNHVVVLLISLDGRWKVMVGPCAGACRVPR